MLNIIHLRKILSKANLPNLLRYPSEVSEFLKGLRTKFNPIVEIDSHNNIFGFEALLTDKNGTPYNKIKEDFKQILKNVFEELSILRLLDTASILLHANSINELKTKLSNAGHSYNNLLFTINIGEELICDRELLSIIDDFISEPNICFEISEDSKFWEAEIFKNLALDTDCFIDDIFKKHPPKFVLDCLKTSQSALKIVGLKYDYSAFQQNNLDMFKDHLKEIFNLDKSYYLVIEGIEKGSQEKFIKQTKFTKTKKIYLQGKHIEINKDFENILEKVTPFGYKLPEDIELGPSIPEGLLITEKLAQRNDFKKASKFRLVIFQDFENLKDIINDYCKIKSEELILFDNITFNEVTRIAAFSIQYPEKLNNKEMEILKSITSKGIPIFVISPYLENEQFDCLSLGYNTIEKRCYFECHKEKCEHHKKVEDNNRQLLEVLKFYWEKGYLTHDYKIPIYKPSELIGILKWIYDYYLPFAKKVEQIKESVQYNSLFIGRGLV